MRDGKEFAAQIFTPPKKRKYGDDDISWLMQIRREFILMKDNPHVRLSDTLIPITAVDQGQVKEQEQGLDLAYKTLREEGEEGEEGESIWWG